MTVGKNGKNDVQQNAIGTESLLERLWKTPEVKVLFCALGIYSCYLYYGFLHEKLFKTHYGKERFDYAIFLVFVQCCINSLGAAVVHTFLGTKQVDTTPHRKYAIVALAYLCAMVFSFSALRHMSYPMQVLGKSCKMIPVMLMGIVIRRKKYSWKDYLCVFLISIGVAVFSYKPKAIQDGHTTPIGLLLLFLSLTMDGFTGPYQEKIVAEHKPTTHQLMFKQNMWASLWLLIASIVTGEGVTAVEFLSRHPEAIKDVLLFSLASALGQNFIFYTVRNISALACTTITTTRKFFTLLASLLLYKHTLSLRQGVAVAMVFSGIIWETINKHQTKSKKATQAVVKKE
mmetsp:Transcript_1808/g.5483  ORF Transcript_1808/g.5483 Transcript_1808/m.5483 type:complete len:344 (-) Transcript_1808:961-1992(-)|eukprot:CAMPEP_0198723992 /NCGR_PEP_ID=MMETSP1475-20131203/1498_1 /TAXON_ID= ORGANISM="Unidentified sp., Strain CCMP1999" /NCGR_SAMPLE_ID=MMETSP1475 /ASSEMBLY_ACC=CAM_ASM_001111 /LENGTH=343 /DNA_ID=CAMNT_0044485349 /DNA_START=102 /DNA_END=1133 /DNA_ORIENTATION=+